MALVYVLVRKSIPHEIRYVGMSKYDDISKRMSMHRYRLESGNTLPLYCWMRKYKDIIPIVVESHIDREQAVSLEIETISTLREGGYDLLNLTRGGDGIIDMSEESLEKLRQSSTGRKHSEETKRKMSKAKKGKPSWNKGVPMSEESKRRLSESKKGRKLTEEHKEKISKAGVGRTHSEESRRKIGEAHRGKHVSEETRKRLSNSLKGKTPWNKGIKKTN